MFDQHNLKMAQFVIEFCGKAKYRKKFTKHTGLTTQITDCLQNDITSTFNIKIIL